MKEKFLQKVANFIIARMESAKDEDIFMSWYEIGRQFDEWCKCEFEIFLR